jgi:hypothetical protein
MEDGEELRSNFALISAYTVKSATEGTEDTEMTQRKKELHRFQTSLILYDRKEFGEFGVIPSVFRVTE